VPEVRVDPLTGLRSIVASDRATRPGARLQATPADPIDPAADPFLEGHEDRTPPEVDAFRDDGAAPDTPGWSVRVVPNLYPALDPHGAEPAPDARPDLFGVHAARGAHEVIVNAPQPVSSLAELEDDQVALAMEMWRRRMRHHADAGASHVHLIVNERREGGASLPHTHAQLYALDFVPTQVARERERYGAYAVRTMGADLLQDLVQEEVKRRERIVAIDDEAVLLAPWGSRLPYQLMLAPRRPRRRFEDDGPTGAALLREALRRLGRALGAQPPLNLWVRTAPRDAERFCWRIDIVPRLTAPAGLELGAGVDLCIVAPEQAAAALREL
jgi:UDPglucose--hexose-1-phosphate uridylyltransferase